MNALDHTTAGAEQYDETVGLRGWVALATGLNLAFLVCMLLCKAPDALALSWPSRLLTAFFDLGVASLFGVFGTRLVLLSSSGGYLRSLLLCGARGWVFLPAIALFLQQGSLWAPLLAIVAAALMASYLSRFLLLDREPEIVRSQQAAQDMFTVEVAVAPASWVPLGLSCCFYGVFLAALADRMLLEMVLLATGTLLLVLQVNAQRDRAGSAFEQGQGEKFPQGARLAVWTTVAFCCTLLSLSESRALYMPFLYWHRATFGPKVVKQSSASDHASGGYHTIVLWPLQKKEKTIIAPREQSAGTSSGLTRPWSIPFDGPYWYFQFAAESPGPNSRTAHGDPLKANVRSTDEGALLMEAHQHLSQPLDLTCCRAIQIVLKNDVTLGAFAVGLSLTDSHAKGVRSQSLGVKIADPGAAHGGTSPIEQVLSFPFPKHRLIRSFDAVTVSLLPDAKHRTIGRKVAIERFILMPR